ncbi:MAG: hypothetical protein LH618_14495, partial [Saprospiraceae bacterium]|nr:hypothetical protein [Saprospiraceae bacterium]
MKAKPIDWVAFGQFMDKRISTPVTNLEAGPLFRAAALRTSFALSDLLSVVGPHYMDAKVPDRHSAELIEACVSLEQTKGKENAWQLQAKASV